MRKILQFFNMPVNEARLECLMKHKNGLFHREASKTPQVVAFNPEIRSALDHLIDHVNEKILKRRGYDEMPTHLYSYYKKTDEEILQDIKDKNQLIKPSVVLSEEKQSSLKHDRVHGTKMVLEQYIKWLDLDGESALDIGADATASDDAKSQVMKELFKRFKQNSHSNTITGLSEKAEGILSKAVELWPILQRPFAKDPIEDAIETDGFRGNTISELTLPA